MLCASQQAEASHGSDRTPANAGVLRGFRPAPLDVVGMDVVGSCAVQKTPQPSLPV
jgi:hypothetical protein